MTKKYLIEINPKLAAKRNEVGGKGKGILYLAQQNLLVPPGFIISAKFFDHLLKQSGVKDTLLNTPIASLNFNIIKNQFIQFCCSSPDFQKLIQIVKEKCFILGLENVSVRSSYTDEDQQEQSFAGLFETSLNIDIKKIKQAILTTWGSFFKAEIFSYKRRSKKKNKMGSMAVIIQKMISSDIAGVAFTYNVMTHNDDEIVVEYGFGSCSDIVSGGTAKLLLLHKKVKNTHLQFFPKAKLFAKLSQVLLRLEKQLDYYIDVEWCFHKNDLFLLQIRPVTGHIKQKSHYIFHARNNTSMWLTDGIRKAYFNSRKYNIITDALYYVHKGYFERFLSLHDYKERVKQGYKLLDNRYFLKIKKGIEKTEINIKNLLHKLQRFNDQTLSSVKILELLKEMNAVLHRAFFYFEFSSSDASSVLFHYLLCFMNREDALTLSLYTNLDEIDYERIDLEKLQQKKTINESDLLQHLYQYPWIVTNCYSKKKALYIVKDRVDNFDAKNVKSEILSFKNNIKAKQNQIIKKYSLGEKILKKVEQLQYIGYSRLKMKRGYVASDFYILSLLEKISHKTKVSLKDIHHYYFFNELISLIKDTHKISDSLIEKRKKPFLIHIEGNEFSKNYRAKEIKIFQQQYIIPSIADYGETIEGTSANSGIIEGFAMIVLANDPQYLNKITSAVTQETILICDMIQPSMNFILKKAGGVVTDEGGVLSHAAIIAREYNKPCVVGTKIASKFIKNGDRIIVNASLGKVFTSRTP